MNVLTSTTVTRISRRAATRREVVLPCQAVRERDFKLVADRTLDISVDGLLLPVKESLPIGESLIVSFPIPGLWIDAEAIVTRVVRGRRPADEGKLAVGVVFDVIAPATRAALAGFLHGRPPPLPRRGPMARLRRGARPPQLADHAVMAFPVLAAPPPAIEVDDAAELVDDAVDGLDVLRAVVTAWQDLVATAE